MRAAGVAWAVCALALAEAGARWWPLLAAGLAPLAAALVLAAGARLPGPSWGGRGPVAVLRAAMLPMMATLPAMGVWCSAAGLSLPGMAALHLAAMLLPAWLLRAPSAGLCRVLLAAGGLALAAPGLQGLILASLLHGAAAGVACAGPAPAADRRAAMLVPALGVLGIGWLLDRHGPIVLVAGHALLAVAALWPTAGVSTRAGAAGAGLRYCSETSRSNCSRNALRPGAFVDR